MTDINKFVIDILKEEMEKQKISGRALGEKTGFHNTNIYRMLNGKNGRNERLTKESKLQLNSAERLLRGLGLKIVVEDEEAEWGLDVRLRRMPKKLYRGERIEAREIVEQHGFYGRVDLFDSPEMVLKFIPKPCDVYEIRPGKLIRKYFDVVDHPYGLMYSFSENIPPEYIVNKVTYR